MSIYSSTEVYPTSFDEITPCKECDFECGTVGYCLDECGENYIVSSLLHEKGYVQANMDIAFINGKDCRGIEVYKRQAHKLCENLSQLGQSCFVYEHPFGKKYLATVIIENLDFEQVCLDLLKLDVIK